MGAEKKLRVRELFTKLLIAEALDGASAAAKLTADGYNSVFHMLCAPFVFNSLYVFTIIIAEMIKVKISDTGIE